jgi:hypothetical protein
MKPRAILILLIGLLIGSSASMAVTFNKANYIKKYESWITELQGEYKTYTKSDWAKAEKKFTQFSVTDFMKYEPELTDSEKAKLDGFIGSYYGMRLIFKARQAKLGAKSVVNIAKGLFDQVSKEVGK